MTCPKALKTDKQKIDMGNLNLKPTDEAALLATIDPQSNAAASTLTSDYVDMSNFASLMALIKVGAFVATGKVDAKLVQATAAAGTNKKDITGKAITQLTAAGTDDNKQAIINLFASELDSNNGFRYVALELVNTTAAALVDASLLGFGCRYAPASDNDLASVDEIV